MTMRAFILVLLIGSASASLLGGCAPEAEEQEGGATSSKIMSCLPPGTGTCAEWDDGAPGAVCGYVAGEPRLPSPRPCPPNPLWVCRVSEHQVVYYYGGAFEPRGDCRQP